MSNTDTPKDQDLKIVYVDTSNASYHGRLTAYVDGGATIAELTATAELLQDQQGVSSVEPYFDGTTAALRIYSPTGEFSDKVEADLLELLSPQFTRKVSAEAVIQRDNTGVHESTRISMRVTAGDNLTGFNKDRSYDNKDGAQRVRVIGSDATTVIFLMKNPVAHDDDGAITAVVQKMAEKLNAMLTMPITVKEPNEFAALDETKDFRSETPAQSVSTPAAS